MSAHIKKVLLFGHGGFYNRGCEAIVESTVEMLRSDRFGLAYELLSFDARRDRTRTTGAVDRIQPGYAPLLTVHGLVARIVHRVSPARSYKWLSHPVRTAIRSSDIALSIGGDNYCYEDPPYFYYVDDLIRRAGIPLILWGATVELGNPSAAKLSDLRNFDAITARESLTVQALEAHGITKNVRLVADPAFVLRPKSIGTSEFWPKRARTLGLNLSPLIGRYAEAGTDSILQAGALLVRYAVDKCGVGVLLIPHVTEPMPPKERWNDDARFLARIQREANRPDAVSLMPSGLSAGETKFVISRCDWFIGARTHSTIAGLSSGVPTVTIAYSAKAVGINTDVFGDARWVLDTKRIGPEQLIGAFEKMKSDENGTKELLNRRIPEVARRSREGADVALEILSNQG